MGRSGVDVSEIGFGAWGIGGVTAGATSYGVTDDRMSLRAIERAVELGITFFDTANVYGDGHSERLLGQALKGRRDEVVIATKAGFADFSSAPDYSPASLRKSLEGSLARLATDYIDLFQLHNPAADWLKAHPETLDTLAELQREGKARHIGVSVKAPPEALAMIDLFPFAAVQANFNMLDIRALESGVFDRLAAAGVGFIARTPLAFGFLTGALTGDEDFPPEDHRSRWSREQRRLWADGARDLYACCAEASAAGPAECALRFCLSYPEVTTCIAGMLTADEVDVNVAASDAGPLDHTSCAEIEALHRTRSFIAR